MCGIFFTNDISLKPAELDILVNCSERRGKDASGIAIQTKNGCFKIFKSFAPLTSLTKKQDFNQFVTITAHSRLMTNGANDNQPIVTENCVVFHNGIILNEAELCQRYGLERKLEVDSEVIALIIEKLLCSSELDDICLSLLNEIDGTLNIIVLLPLLSKVIILSNHGSLYHGTRPNGVIVASEQSTLQKLKCENITNIKNSYSLIDVNPGEVEIHEDISNSIDLIPKLNINTELSKHTLELVPNLERCTRCILPSTMPFIEFDKEGVCNYCRSYKPVLAEDNLDALRNKLQKYQRMTSRQENCIVPFSGGRDSCFALHIICKELGLKPVTYTYDWGMVTDLGRRNISLMSKKLRVENITIAADIRKKRENIRKNLIAWLTNPNIGLLSLLTAGDKFFFKYVDTIKSELGIDLNIWGINPLETTHFKTGFLGQRPNFDNQQVYASGLRRQSSYHISRFREMYKGSGFFNKSIWDTLAGEYYRSVNKKTDYIHLFDYLRWDETDINSTLDMYGWERATDTTTTWRIGDGTAAFYNYATFLISGFTEHDTFRSNQIREGMISREEALELVKVENMPRHENLQWYFDSINLDGVDVIKRVNAMPRLYE